MLSSLMSGLVGLHGYTGLSTLQEQYSLLEKAHLFLIFTAPCSALRDTCKWNQCITHYDWFVWIAMILHYNTVL